MHAPPIALSVEALLVRCHYRWRTVTHTKAGGGLYHALPRCRLCMVQVELRFRVRLYQPDSIRGAVTLRQRINAASRRAN
jgi:hypothetical protein